jgi:large subunit ribosomal protein L25
MRILSGSKITLDIPVEFKNHSESPGLKRGGVLNIVRRKVELKCPADNIPDNIVIDLAGLDIGTSIKISSVNLSEGVTPTIVDRDFVIATVAAPTVIKEPEKPAEAETAEGDAVAATDGTETSADAAKDGEAAKKDDKGKEQSGDKKQGGDKKQTPEKKATEKK